MSSCDVLTASWGRRPANTGDAVDRADGHRRRALLLAHDVPDRLARFAGTHGTWTAPDRTVDDLLLV